MRVLARTFLAIAKVLLVCFAVVLCASVLTFSVIAVGCRGGPEPRQSPPPTNPERSKYTAGLPAYARPEVVTFLSYPEWYIVWSYGEKATFQATHLPSGFPYFGAIGQYWRGYCTVNRLAQRRYGFDPGAHLMLMVIGTSFTVEYALKGAYEKTIGRISEWLSAHQMVAEDTFAANVSRQYADFVLVRPFYEFSFLTSLLNMWKETPVLGRHPLRKMERRLFLSFDYAVEAFYCQLIQLATRSAYGVAGSETYAWIDNANDSVFVLNQRIRRVQSVGHGSYLVIIPRYQEFAPTAIRLVERGVRFSEIAGNDDIVLSALAPDSFAYTMAQGRLLFSTMVLSEAGRKRVVVLTPVQSLHTVLAAMRARGLEVEHIYDY